MTNKLIQVACGESARLLELAAPLHASYCEERGIVYAPRAFDQGCRTPPGRKKIAVLVESLKTLHDGDLLICLDSDALVVGDEDISQALPEGDLGLVRTSHRASLRLGPFNSGAMWVRISQATRGFFEAVLSSGPYPTALSWHETMILNRELRHADDLKVVALDPRYYAMDNAPAIVRSVRGFDAISTGANMRSAVNAQKIRRAKVATV